MVTTGMWTAVETEAAPEAQSCAMSTHCSRPKLGPIYRVPGEVEADLVSVPGKREFPDGHLPAGRWGCCTQRHTTRGRVLHPRAFRLCPT